MYRQCTDIFSKIVARLGLTQITLLCKYNFVQIPEQIFKSYDIRGLYPGEINEENIVFITRAFYRFLQNSLLKDNLTVVLSRDMRLSSPTLHKVALETLLDLGAKVVDINLSSTPTFYFAVFKNGYDGGMQISASHNPKDYNGMKMVQKGEKGLIKIGKTTGMEEIKKLALQNLPAASKNGQLVKVNPEQLLNEEVENALSLIGNPKLKNFKIVADAANAMGATYLEYLFKQIPGELIKMNFELDGSFPSHQPDPLQKETLIDLQTRVKEVKADLGLAPDGDGDRMFFVDEKGDIIPPSVITALVARELLKDNPGGKILFDIRYILTPKKAVENFKGEPVVTKVGHAFITEKMGEVGGLFAGESSGHYFFSATGNAESQLPVVLTVLKVMTEEEKPISEIVAGLQSAQESGEINFEVKDSKKLFEAIEEKYQEGQLNKQDGLAISFPDWRFSLRLSNTEPLVRLNMETTLGDDKKVNELVELIKSIG